MHCAGLPGLCEGLPTPQQIGATVTIVQRAQSQRTWLSREGSKGTILFVMPTSDSYLKANTEPLFDVLQKKRTKDGPIDQDEVRVVRVRDVGACCSSLSKLVKVDMAN